MQQSCHRENDPRLFVHIQTQNGAIAGRKVQWADNQLPRGKLYIGLLFLISFLTVSGAIKITHFQVPEAVERGKSAVLHCDYSLDRGEELYSIKLYKDQIEFFRYVPGETPAIQSYKLNGINVNLAESNSTYAVLTRTNLHSDGLYVCEISTEGPSFSTVRSEQLMKIYVLPNESVQIDGALDQYNYGDNISLVCKAGKSWPQAQIHWFINGKLVDNNLTKSLPPEVSSGLVATRLALNYYAKSVDFRNGALEIKCTATLLILYEYESTEHLVTGSFKNKSNDRANWRKEWSMQPNTKSPVISGMKRDYRPNNYLKLNCSTSTRNAKLKWFIMNREVNETHLVRYERLGNRVLGLWIRMEKKFIQMPELRLRCLSYYPKQIAQFDSQLQIRTYDNQSWGESQFASIGAVAATQPTSVSLLAVTLFLVHFIVPIAADTIY